MERYYWNGYCHKERIGAITDLEKIICKYGFIVDFNMFSDISINLRIVIEKRKIDPLYSELTLYLDLDNFNLLNTSSTDECIILFQITFSKGTGDLRIEVPSVPG